MCPRFRPHGVPSGLSILVIALAISACASIEPSPPETNAPGNLQRHLTHAVLHPAAQANPHTTTPSALAIMPASPYVSPRRRHKTAYDNVWDRVRDGFSLPPLDSKYVSYYEDWYAKRPHYWTRMMDRAGGYLYHIVSEVENRGLPTELALLPAIESAFRPEAYSRAHAVGLWQFIPATAKRYGLEQTWWYDGRKDTVEATRAALDYLEFLHLEFDNDWFHALAAYNAGEARVLRAIAHNRKRNRSIRYETLKLKRETIHYVPKLIAIKNILSDPAKFGLDVPSVPNLRHFSQVTTRSQIDLKIVAELAGISLQQVRALNPGCRRWATDPDGPHYVLIPADRKITFLKALDRLSPKDRMRWVRHQIRGGDTLIAISQRYGVTVNAIRRANKIKGSLIRAGRDLFIPVSGTAYAGTQSQELDASSPGPTVHRVRSGDTLWALARHYRVYIRELTKWNAIRANDTLRLGQKILVYRN